MLVAWPKSGRNEYCITLYLTVTLFRRKCGSRRWRGAGSPGGEPSDRGCRSEDAAPRTFPKVEAELHQRRIRRRDRVGVPVSGPPHRQDLLTVGREGRASRTART